MARKLDEHVGSLRPGRWTLIPTWSSADAPVLKARRTGRLRHALLRTGVNSDGHLEIRGLHVTSDEEGAGSLGSFRVAFGRL